MVSTLSQSIYSKEPLALWPDPGEAKTLGDLGALNLPQYQSMINGLLGADKRSMMYLYPVWKGFVTEHRVRLNPSADRGEPQTVASFRHPWYGQISVPFYGSRFPQVLLSVFPPVWAGRRPVRRECGGSAGACAFFPAAIAVSPARRHGNLRIFAGVGGRHAIPQGQRRDSLW